MYLAFWNFAHNCIAHPLLFVTREHYVATWLHDWTAKKAWPRADD